MTIHIHSLTHLAILLAAAVVSWLIGWWMRGRVEDGDEAVRKAILVRLVAERPRGLTAEDFDLVFNRHRRSERIAWLEQRMRHEGRGGGDPPGGGPLNGPEAA